MQYKDTDSWIYALERNALVDDCDRFFTKPDFAKIINQVSIISSWKNSEKYIQKYVQTTSPNNKMISALEIKHFIIIIQMISLLEPIFSEEGVSKIRTIKAGLLPDYSSRLINACATKSPYGDDVIFFSDGLFTFLWNYYEKTYAAFYNTELTESQKQKLADDVEREMISNLSSSHYRNFSFENYKNMTRELPAVRVSVCLSILFVWLHELGHVFLKHEGMPKPSLTKIGEHTVLEYSKSIRQEFEADRFAIDCFIHLITKIDPVDENQIEQALVDGLKLIELFSKAEGYEGADIDWNSASHPPSALRMAYMIMRHEELFRKCSRYGVMVDEFKAIQSQRGTFGFDYTKPNGLEHLLRTGL